MVRDDTTIEDAGKRDHGTGNEIEELNSKSLDAEIEIEGEKLQCDAGGPNKIEDGEGQCLNVSKKEAEDNVTVNNEMEDQTNPERETNEPMPVEGVTGEQINTVSKNEERSNAEEQTVIGQVDDAKNEVVEQHASNGGVEVDKSAENGGVKVEKSGENGVEGGNSVKNVIEEKYADSGVEMENPVKNVIAEKTAEIGVEGENLLENVTAKKNAENGVEEGNPVRNVLEGNNAEENGMKEGNPVKTVLVERNDENCVEGGNDPVKYVIEGNPDIEFKAEKDNNNERKIQNTQFTPDIPSNEAPPNQNSALDKVLTGGDEEMEDTANKGNEVKEDNEDLKEQGKGILRASPVETETKHEGDHSSLPIKHEAAATPSSIVRYLPAKAGDLSGETAKMALMSEGDEGTPEDQAAFMQEIESFYRERAMDFKPPKFYGQPLNCLKLWRAVVRLGGYDRVTGSKLWRQVGESFHPPKTCTTVSWTFRIFYEKSLLEYERHKTQSGELQLPVAALHEASGADTEGNGYQGTGAGRAKRDAASRAMQGWHVQRLFGNGEVGEPAVKDKNIINMAKREKNVKTIGSLKQKRPNEVESSVKVARIETSKQLAITVVDVGPPADWVKVNVRQTKDCFEVYALVPGLLREEVRVQSDPAGRLVITGQPEQVDNPWGIMPFKKVISLPLRIDPLQTSAVVSLHGRLFVRVPFEQSNG